METTEAQQNQQSTPQTQDGKPSFMDRQFVATSGCGRVLIVILFPFIALILGLIGLLACKDAKARSSAGTMALIGGIWFAISISIFIWMINSAPK